MKQYGGAGNIYLVPPDKHKFSICSLFAPNHCRESCQPSSGANCFQRVRLDAGPSTGFRSRGTKSHKGGCIFKYNIGCMQQPGDQTLKWGAQTLNGVSGHHCPPAGDGPGWMDFAPSCPCSDVHIFLNLSDCVYRL